MASGATAPGIAARSRRRTCREPAVLAPPRLRSRARQPRRAWYRLVLAACLLGAAALPPAGADGGILRLATTTTTDNSGLVSELVPAFERETGYRVRVIAVGSGRALRLLANGDVDVALTHARHLERRAAEDGGASSPQPVMYNDFLLVGPVADPAGVRRAADVRDALRRIAARAAPFVSRGDDSGTHVRELALWTHAGLEPAGDWYREAGQGMGRTLQIAGELDAYTLVDRGTWLAYRGRSPLGLVLQGDDRLMNVYSALAANPERHPAANLAGAKAFIDWMRSPAARRLIRDFQVDGHPLFVPVL